MNVKKTLLCMVVGLAARVGAAQNTTLSEASWIAGCWESKAGNTVVSEQWMAPDGGLMVGMSRNVRDGSASGYEFILLRESDKGLVYTAFPSGQTTTDFRSIDVTPELLRFTNPEHDFPQKIEYWKIAGAQLHAKVFGDVSAAEPAFVLKYYRVACPGL